MKGFFVYFYYGSNDELLYIGKAVDVGKRWQSHQEEWKSEVCKIGVREYPDHASMDIFEHYYITKNPTKYNKGLLSHGSTKVNINDLTTMTIYSLDKFKKKYVSYKTGERKKIQRILYNTIDEKYAAAGYEIIYSNKVNYFDKSLWRKNLNRTLFRFKDVCFQISPLKAKDKPSTTVNQSVEALYKILSKAIEITESYVISEIDGDFLTIEDAEAAEKCSHIEINYIDTYKNGREHICKWCGANIFGRVTVYEENGKCYVKINFSSRSMKENYVSLNKNNFTFDLESNSDRSIYNHKQTTKSTL